MEETAASTIPSAGQLAGEARQWFEQRALPLWLERGLDRKRGGFYEALTQERAENTSDFKRLRVATRQIYVFAAGMRLGNTEAREGLLHGIDFLLGKARHPDGGFANRFDMDGQVTDPTRDLYDLAFAAFALAHAYDVTRGTALRDEALSLVGFITDHMRHSEGGFLEALPPREPRRQNPHMHLLEAALAWTELDPIGPYSELARELATLFRDRLYQAETGTLPEFFEETLVPRRCDDFCVIEPGHHFEWVWLLHLAVRLGITAPGSQATALYRFAHVYGLSVQSGLPIGAVAPDGRPRPADTRLWSATEWVKAEAVMRGPEQDRRLARAWKAVERFLDTPQPGLWHEHWDEQAQRFRPGPAPATSLYHLVLAIEVLCEHAGIHPRPFAGRMV